MIERSHLVAQAALRAALKARLVKRGSGAATSYLHDYARLLVTGDAFPEGFSGAVITPYLHGRGSWGEPVFIVNVADANDALLETRLKHLAGAAAYVQHTRPGFSLTEFFCGRNGVLEALDVPLLLLLKPNSNDGSGVVKVVQDDRSLDYLDTCVKMVVEGPRDSAWAAAFTPKSNDGVTTAARANLGVLSAASVARLLGNVQYADKDVTVEVQVSPLVVDRFFAPDFGLTIRWILTSHFGYGLLYGLPVEMSFGGSLRGQLLVWVFLDPNNGENAENRERAIDEWLVRVTKPALLKAASDLGVEDLYSEWQQSALRSALAAIMSRNMSHNIGSHVLSRLGRAKGGGWYTQRYLQQRMDFLAQIATEWPTWEEPAWVLQDLMRWFLHQQDVLENIALSEGLRAHRFRQDKVNAGAAAAPNTAPADQTTGDIRLHVFLVPEPLWCADVDGVSANDADTSVTARIQVLRKGCAAAVRAGEAPGSHLPCSHGAARQADAIGCRRVLLYTPPEGTLVDGADAVVRTDEDPLVSIPGGLVGYQAFYVVLENVLRNAAKHGQRTNGAPLHIVIEIFYDPDSTLTVRDGEEQEHRRAPCTLVRVYDSASLLNDGKVERWGDDGINARLQADLIDGTGKLRQGNWGLSEMRIAAAFLQRRTIEHVGAGGEMITGPRPNGEGMDETMLASAKSGGSPYVLRAIRSPIGTLGYELFLLRPQTLAIALPRVPAGQNGESQ